MLGGDFRALGVQLGVVSDSLSWVEGASGPEVDTETERERRAVSSAEGPPPRWQNLCP